MNIYAIVTVVMLFIGLYSTSHNSLEKKNLDELVIYVSNHIENLNMELKNSGFDIEVNKFDSYNITICKYDDNYVDGKFLLFDNGLFYLLIGDGATLYDYGTSIANDKITAIKNKDVFYNELTNEYYFLDGSDIYSLDNYDYYKSKITTPCGNKKIFAGQSKAGEGYIYDTSSYVKDRYGDKYKLIKSNSLNYYTSTKGKTSYPMEGFEQSLLSCYTDSGTLSGENNCCTVAPYTIARFIMRSKYRKKGYADNNVEIYNPKVEEPDLYKEKIESGKYEILASNRRYWCELYRNFRRKAYEKYGKVEDLTIWQSSALLENVMADYYGISLNAIEELAWGIYLSKMPNEIDDNKPLMWTSVGGTYDNHIVSVAGYEIWEKTQKILFFTQKVHIIIGEVRDNYSTSARYYDFIGFTGAACFVRIDF